MNLHVNIRGLDALASMAGRSEALHAAMVRVMTRLSVEVQAAVKGQKLTGQVLHVRTGTLRRSINRRVDDVGGSVTATVGTNVRYARVHEFGFSGDVDVREHVRKNKSGQGTKVRAHTRRVNMPERSFLRSTVDEMAPHIRAEIRKAALAAIRS